MRTDMNLTGKIAVQNFKRSVGAWLTPLALLAVASTSVHALQTVEPALSVGGATIAGSTRSLPAGSSFSFFGVYSDDSAGPESGLGLKVKYNGTHLTNVSITEEFTKCRIAVAQVPTPATATDQVVMGWIDTAIRPTGLPATATGAVGWPDLIDAAATGLCLNPGNINTDTAAVAPTGLKLFKFTATMAAGCTTPALCTSTVELNSDGNYSYASATPGMTPKTFTIQGAAAPTCNLDVDGNGSVTAFRDGILIIRHLLGLTSSALISGLSPAPDPNVVATNVNNILSAIDVNGNLPTPGTTAFVDGILLIRMMLGLNGTALTSGITLTAANSVRSTPAALVNYVNQTCNTTFTP
jgi:hypothetical protein